MPVKLPVDPALPQAEALDVEAWRRRLGQRLNLLFRSIIDRVNWLFEGRFQSWTGLPAPDANDRGRLAWAEAPAGNDDTLHWGRRLADGTYAWERILFAQPRTAVLPNTNVPDGGVATWDIAASEARLGDAAVVAWPGLNGLVLVAANVPAAGTVRVSAYNRTGAAVNLGGTVYVFILRR